VSCLFSVAYSKTLRDEKATLFFFALLRVSASHCPANHKSYFGGHIHRLLMTFGLRSFNNERDARSKRKTAGPGNGIAELGLPRLDNLHDHFHAETAIVLGSKDGVKGWNGDRKIYTEAKCGAIFVRPFPKSVAVAVLLFTRQPIGASEDQFVNRWPSGRSQILQLRDSEGLRLALMGAYISKS
jgi:hypothetical protein